VNTVMCFGFRKGSEFREKTSNYKLVVLGGIVDIVLAIRPKVRGFSPGRGRWILRAIKARITPSFGGEVKSSAPWHVKNPI
jgi:hypothetical protein